MINSFTVSIVGLSELAGGLELGEDYQILIQGTCNQIAKSDNEDGSVTYKHKIKQKTAEIKSSDGRVVVVKDKMSQSAKLRAQLHAIALDRQLEPEAFYEATLVKFRHYTMEILDFIEGLEK